eukprot:UC4_evm2s436
MAWCPSGWVAPPESGVLPKPPLDVKCQNVPCIFPNTTYEFGGVYLFDIEADVNVVDRLRNRLNYYINLSIPQDRGTIDPASNPKNFGGVWTPWIGDKDPAACDAPKPSPSPPTPNPIDDFHSHISSFSIEYTSVVPVLVGNLWCFDGSWPGGGVQPMTVVLSFDGSPVRELVANASRPAGFMNATGAPNLNHGLYLRERGKWVEQIASKGKHRLDLDTYIEVSQKNGSKTMPLNGSPICFVDGNETYFGDVCRALIPWPSPPPAPPSQYPDVWYSPHFDFSNGVKPPSNFFPLLTSPETSWPKLARRTTYLKLKMSALYPIVSSTDLFALQDKVKSYGFKIGLEIGGARWGAGFCDAASMLRYAKKEQEQASRWLALGGQFDSITTDHAATWDIRHELNQQHCSPPVNMEARIDIMAQVLASWRVFLGPHVKIGFIESLGYWDITAPGGFVYRNTDPDRLNNISGWIPKLSDFTAKLISAATRYNPSPKIPLIDHYQIDYGMDGVEQDTIRCEQLLIPLNSHLNLNHIHQKDGGTPPPLWMNYGRILGAESVMKEHGIKTGILLNANAAHMRTYAPNISGCLVACDPTFSPSHSAVLRTLNITRGYMTLLGRSSSHAIFEQWQTYPNVTGPETLFDSALHLRMQKGSMPYNGSFDCDNSPIILSVGIWDAFQT